mmetsp:Transcript_56995/g.121008  ORF Transcript_56995/g.121008 Transcript_56995/m.121008 type:complete len:523 (+) Transcript_56995:26-1594(+)
MISISMSMMKALQLSAFAAATTCCVLLGSASTADAANAASNAMVPSPTGASFFRPGSRRRSAFATTVPKRRHSSGTRRSSRSRMELAGKKNKYGGEENKMSQEELLLDLESRVDHYEGRIPSKISTTSSEEETDDDATPHRCALVTIVGRPNMGKSTLLNALLSDELAIATNRPQTTRHAILGVMTTDRCQICLTDTPGIITAPAYGLQEGMMEAVRGAARDADVFLVVTDVYSAKEKSETDEDEESAEEDRLGIGEEMLDKLRNSYRPVIVCVNKVDLVADEEDGNAYTNTPAMAVRAVRKWRSVLPDAFAVLPTCAANGPDDPGVVALRSMLLANDPGVDVGSAIRGLGRPIPGMFAADAAMISEEEAREILPAGPPLYHPDFFTDRTDRFCASELIRETLFESLGKELPYCCEVRVESFDESQRYPSEDDRTLEGGGENSSGGRRKGPMIRIGATILVERDSQKGIVVGKGGQKVRDVGTDARRKLELFFGAKVFLDLRVKVDKNWRDDKDKLKKYGYM